MEKVILLGDEAVALGAIHSGITTACGYPGTPSTEIFEYIQRYAKKYSIHAKWSANEKVGYEESLGASYTGRRSIVTMKHVGLNVAADPFMNSGVTGVNGGIIVAVADDPSMHSSQNEQDTRYYANFAKILCLEPSTQQEAYYMTGEGFTLSEKFKIPVLIRLVTRLAHSRSIVQTKESVSQTALPVSSDPTQWTLLPINARKQYQRLLNIQPDLLNYAQESSFNKLELKDNCKTGVIVSGIAYNYFQESLQRNGKEVSYLKIGTYPLPIEKIRKLFDSVEKVFVFEEGYPFIEEKLAGILPNNYKIHGMLDGTLPPYGELTPEIVHLALENEPIPHEKDPELAIPPRPPALCKGCPHIDLYKVLNSVMDSYPEGRVFSDIGCYTLGALPPYNAITTCVDMGASISMAKGAADCDLTPSVAVLGDSTFAHSGMTPLIGAARENTNLKLIILDNAAVAMTGGQKTMSTGENLLKLVKGLGVKEEHIREFVSLPKNFESNKKIMEEEFKYQGLSVIISRRECIQTAKRRIKKG